MFLEVSNNLKKLAKLFPENLFIVGGYVRNQVLKIENSDVDLCSSVDIDQVCERLKNTDFCVKVKNLKYGTLLISKGSESYEYTTFRKEFYKDNDGHCPSKIVFTKKLEEDAKRRDFTINSIYYNINKDEIVDIYHGIIDIKEKIIRCTCNEILSCDGERILRMIRFSGELNFSIDKNTMQIAKKYISNINDLAGIRKFAELEKILYCDKRYKNIKSNLKKTLNLLNKLSIWDCFGLKCKKVKYKMVFKIEDRVLGLLIDIIDTQKPECLQAFLEKFLQEQFGLGENIKQKIYDYLAGYYYALKKQNNKEYFFDFYRDWAYIYPLLGAKSKRIQNKYNFFYQYIIEHGLVIEISDLKINESDLAVKFKEVDKRHYPKILRMLLSKVFDGKVNNQKQDLLNEVEKNLHNYC